MNAVSSVCSWVFVVVVASWSPRAEAITYAGGSPIIPTQASFQNGCGTASTYGLVYDVLRANDWLAAHGKARVTVHWAYRSRKNSPNRCVPTDAHRPPAYGSYTASNPPPGTIRIGTTGATSASRTAPACR